MEYGSDKNLEENKPDQNPTEPIPLLNIDPNVTPVAENQGEAEEQEQQDDEDVPEEERDQQEEEFIEEAKDATGNYDPSDIELNPQEQIQMVIEETKIDNTPKDESPKGSIPIEERFLTRAQNYLEEITDADPKFKKLVNLVTLSSMLERFRIIESTTEGGKQLNLWGMPYGEARETHKTTVIDRITKRVERVEEMNHAFIQLGDEMTLQGLTALDKLLKPRKSKKEEKDMPTPPPDVLKEIEEEEKRRYKVLFWNVDEAGGIVAEMNNKLSYLRGLTHMLSKLYDGAKYVRITMMHGYEKLDSPYLTILLTGTPQMPKALGIEAFDTGFAVRFIFYNIKTAPNRPKPEALSRKGLDNQDFYENYLSALFKVKDYIPIFINKTTGNARELIDNYVNNKYAEIKKEIAKEETLLNRLTKIYYGNLENLIERLSGIYAIDRTITIEQLERMGQPIFKRRGEMVTVLRCDVECAIKIIEDIVLTGLEETLHLVASQNTQSLKIESDDILYQTAIDIIRKTNTMTASGIREHAITTGALARALKLKPFRYKDMITGLENMGYVTQEYAVHMKRGGPAILVILNEEPKEDNKPQEVAQIDLDKMGITK
jgi:hypothetical protein